MQGGASTKQEAFGLVSESQLVVPVGGSRAARQGKSLAQGTGGAFRSAAGRVRTCYVHDLNGIIIQFDSGINEG